MPKPVLAIDIGNTNITLGAFVGDELRDSWRISTERRRTADEYRPLLRDILTAAELSFQGLAGAIIASVVPPVLQELKAALTKENVSVHSLTGGSNVGLVVRYDPPESVGADRMANAIAATAMFGTPAIIVDLGTATTLEVVDVSGAYVGGSIGPGIEAGMEALFRNAFQLPRLSLAAPPRAIGTNTVDSIRSGAVLGWASMVDGLVERFKVELEGNPFVIATGGLAPLVAPHCRTVTDIEVDLTLHGLRIAFDRLSSTGQPAA